MAEARKKPKKEPEFETRWNDHVPLMYFVVDGEGTILSVNRFGTRTLGYSRSELTGRSVLGIFHPDDRKAVQQQLSDCLKNGPGETREWEFRKIRKDGQVIRVREVAQPFPDEAGRMRVHVICEDITLKKQAQDSRRQADRVEALGLLAGGIAHDLNNILGPVVGYPDILLKTLQADNPMAEDLMLIRDSALRATRVIQNLLTLSQRGSAEKEPVDLNEVVLTHLASAAFEELKRRKPDLTVEPQLAGHLPAVCAAPSSLQQVIANLMENAFESASPPKGVISLRTVLATLSENRAGTCGTLEKGEYVTLALSFKGNGNDAVCRHDVFLPFNSPEETEHNGLDLGRAVVFGVMKEVGGAIDISTHPDRGSRVVLYFPAVKERTERPRAPERARSAADTRKVLVVDDQTEQRLLARRLLEDCGYRVQCAGTPKEALQHARTFKPDLLVLDMLLGTDGDGLDLYRKIADTLPGIRCLIVSGYAESQRVRTLQQLSSGVYLQKPYTADKLARTVEQTLNAPATGT